MALQARLARGLPYLHVENDVVSQSSLRRFLKIVSAGSLEANALTISSARKYALSDVFDILQDAGLSISIEAWRSSLLQCGIADGSADEPGLADAEMSVVDLKAKLLAVTKENAKLKDSNSELKTENRELKIQNRGLKRTHAGLEKKF